MSPDAVSFGVSVISLLTIRKREPRVTRPVVRTSMRADIWAGLRFVIGNPLPRPIAMCTSTWNLFGNIYFALLVLFCVRDLHMTAAAIGIAFSIGSVGAPLGALLASRASRVLGVGPTIVLSAALGCSGLLVAFAPSSQPLPFIIAATFIGGVGVIYNITQVSLRQAICPPAFQGRMNATMRFLVWGTIPIGNVLGGVLGRQPGAADDDGVRLGGHAAGRNPGGAVAGAIAADNRGGHPARAHEHGGWRRRRAGRSPRGGDAVARGDLATGTACAMTTNARDGVTFWNPRAMTVTAGACP